MAFNLQSYILIQVGSRFLSSSFIKALKSVFLNSIHLFSVWSLDFKFNKIFGIFILNKLLTNESSVISHFQPYSHWHTGARAITLMVKYIHQHFLSLSLLLLSAKNCIQRASAHRMHYAAINIALCQVCINANREVSLNCLARIIIFFRQLWCEREAVICQIHCFKYIHACSVIWLYCTRGVRAYTAELLRSKYVRVAQSIVLCGARQALTQGNQ